MDAGESFDSSDSKDRGPSYRNVFHVPSSIVDDYTVDVFTSPFNEKPSLNKRDSPSSEDDPRTTAFLAVIRRARFLTDLVSIEKTSQQDKKLLVQNEKLKSILSAKLRKQLEETIIDSTNVTEYENVKYDMNINIDDDDNIHILVFIDPLYGSSLIFFLEILAKFTKDNKDIDTKFPIWYDVLSKTDENLTLKTVSYPYQL